MKEVIALLTTIVEQNQKLIESNEQKNQIILELVTQMSEQDDEEQPKGTGNLDD